MAQNTYTVTVNNYNAHIDGPETITVQGYGASHDRDGLIIWADVDAKRAAAVFRRWEHVTVERPEPTSAGPFNQERDCTSPDCLKHNGYARPNHEGGWAKVMAAIFGEDGDQQFANIIEWDKKLAETCNDPKVTALLIERAARTGFNAGMAKAARSA